MAIKGPRCSPGRLFPLAAQLTHEAQAGENGCCLLLSQVKETLFSKAKTNTACGNWLEAGAEHRQRISQGTWRNPGLGDESWGVRALLHPATLLGKLKKGGTILNLDSVFSNKDHHYAIWLCDAQWIISFLRACPISQM